MVLVTMLFSAAILLQIASEAEAYIWYGPYTKEKTIYFVDSEYNEYVASITMYIEYYDNPYYLDTKVTKVRVTIDYFWERYDEGYIELEYIAVETGKEPLNTWSSVEIHWDAFPYIYNYEWEPPETYEASPNVYFDLDAGEEGKYGIIQPGYRLVADGNHLYVYLVLVTDTPFEIQLAWQYRWNVVIEYVPHTQDPGPYVYDP